MSKKAIDVKQALDELEATASWFERGEPDIDEGLKKFARAQELIKDVRARLTEAETVIREMRAGEDA